MFHVDVHLFMFRSKCAVETKKNYSYAFDSNSFFLFICVELLISLCFSVHRFKLKLQFVCVILTEHEGRELDREEDVQSRID